MKKVFQLVVIAAMVAAEPPDVPVVAGADDAAAAADDAAAEADDAGADDEEVLVLLEQADIAATSTRPSVGAK